MNFNPPNCLKMTATNINIIELINVLSQIHSTGVNLINLDMIPDENHPAMNKLIIHPIQDNGDPPGTRRIQVRNPNFSTENDDIFNALNDY